VIDGPGDGVESGTEGSLDGAGDGSGALSAVLLCDGCGVSSSPVLGADDRSSGAAFGDAGVELGRGVVGGVLPPFRFGIPPVCGVGKANDRDADGASGDDGLLAMPSVDHRSAADLLVPAPIPRSRRRLSRTFRPT
jgi:hypothetical protein